MATQGWPCKPSSVHSLLPCYELPFLLQLGGQCHSSVLLTFCLVV